MEKTSLKIISQLRDRGYEAYWAGGTVRDFLMGKPPKDYDIVTSAKPEEIEATLRKTIPVGKKFGVILAIEKGHHFEVATFRSDAAYTDGRRPDAVYFTHPEEDAKRRDFTINGMFYDPIEKRVLDFVGGQDDLRRKVVRFIGDPEERIQEDNLRLLRAVRFKNYLGFDYAPGTLEAIKANARLINNVSKERIFDEMSKILTHFGRGEALREFDTTGILSEILPEVVNLKGVRQPEKYHKEGDVFEHTLLALDSLPDKVSRQVAWAVLLHDIGKPNTFSVSDRIRFNEHAQEGEKIVDEIGKRLKFSNEMRQNIKWLVAHHMMVGDIPTMKKARQAHWIHNPLFEDLLEVHRADALGSKPKDLSLYDELKKISDEKELFLPKPDKFLDGEDLKKEFGVEEGPKMGEILEAVHHAQLEEKINSRAEAIEFVRQLLG